MGEVDLPDNDFIIFAHGHTLQQPISEGPDFQSVNRVADVL